MATVTGYFGRIGEGGATKKTFTNYCDRIDLFFLANWDC